MMPTPNNTPDFGALIDIDPMDVPILPRMTGMFSHNDNDQNDNLDINAWTSPTEESAQIYTMAEPSFVTPSPILASHNTLQSQTFSQQAQSPQPIPSEQQEVVTTTTPQQQGDARACIDALAGFFGLSINDGVSLEPQQQQQQRYDTTQPQAPTHDQTLHMMQQSQPQQPTPTKSTPIKFANRSESNNTSSTVSRDSFVEAACHRHHSAPMVQVDTAELQTIFSPHRIDGLPPQDYVDATGHLWRAKYCVLEDEILYFYRNPTDGESPEAIAERREAAAASSSQSESDAGGGGGGTSSDGGGGSFSNAASRMSRRASAKDLSKSPMPRARHLTSVLSSDSCSTTGHMWEKKVFLNCVQAVRSTEQEYGKNSFELIGIDDEINDNKSDDDGLGSTATSINETLVLQAKDQSDMKEWIFQFHRSLASFLRNIMGPYLDLDYFSPQQQSRMKQSKSRQSMLSTSPSEKQLYELMKRHQHLSESPNLAVSLSHGHGRITAHTRRSRQDAASVCSATSEMLLRPGDVSSYRSAGTGSGGLSLAMGDSPHNQHYHHPQQQQQQQYSPLRSSNHGHDEFFFSTTPDSINGSSMGGGSGSPLQQFPMVLKEDQHHKDTTTTTPSSRTATSPALTQKFLIPPSTMRSTAEPATITPTQRQQLQQEPKPQVQRAPELAAPESDYPETERPKPTITAGKKYVPPHLRNKQSAAPIPKSKYVPPHLRKKNIEPSQPPLEMAQIDSPLLPKAPDAAGGRPLNGFGGNYQEPQGYTTAHVEDSLDIVKESTLPLKRGGCADPDVMQGSILDPSFALRKSSRLGKVPTDPYGSFGGGDHASIGIDGNRQYQRILNWEKGAVSECGIRDSNEDAYLMSSDLIEAFRTLPQWKNSSNSSAWNKAAVSHNLGLFAIFDGHCGNEAARFAAENLPLYIFEETKKEEASGATLSPLGPEYVENVLRNAMLKLDDEFCRVCQEEGREWESGATALVALLINEHFVIANLGDCRGVLCRSVQDKGSYYQADDTWQELDTVIDDTGRRSNDVEKVDDSRLCFFKEVTDIHSPSVPEERQRIEKANGWVTTETEIPIGQLRRIDFQDDDVIGILKRCCSNHPEFDGKERRSAPQRILEISRVCGELAVSRALGDRDFKATFNLPADASLDNDLWDCPLCLPFPDFSHPGKFRGDLVSNQPSFQTIKVGKPGVTDEFVLLGCDGLWDVLDVDDAVRVTRDLLYRKQWTAKKAVSTSTEGSFQ